MILSDILIYIFSFIVIWLGSGLIVHSVDRFSKKLKMSSFSVSFFILGLLTTIPELGVGLTAISQNKPEIFVGNLIGGILVVFFFIIPLLAIFGNGIKLNSQLKTKNLLLSFLVMLLPIFFLIDGKMSNLEGFISAGFYLVLFYFIQKNKGFFDNGNKEILNLKTYSSMDLLKIVVGVILIFLSSKIIVDKTLLFAEIIKISPFHISLFVLSIGTNLPELSVGIRSVFSGKKSVAFGNYVGSAAANAFLLGMLTVFNPQQTLAVDNSFFQIFVIVFLGLGLFYYFTRSKNDLSRKEGAILLLVYFIFIILEEIGRR